MFDLKRVSILIVDDDVDVRESLYDLFALKGFTNVKIAQNGFEALKLIEEGVRSGRYFDLIITDVIMPEINGFELVDKVCKLSPKSLIFMMTATHLDDVKARYFSGQIQGFFKKPFNLNFLFQMLFNVFEMLDQK